MAQEIERKFLVNPLVWHYLPKPKPIYIQQNYIFRSNDLSLRARIKGETGYLTIKKGTGISRLEYEYEIPLADAKELMMLESDYHPIEKNRYEISFEGKIWEVDVFLGDNAGLVVAELELSSEDEAFSIPEWIGREVTKTSKYLNVKLQERPYKFWKDKK